MKSRVIIHRARPPSVHSSSALAVEIVSPQLHYPHNSSYKAIQSICPGISSDDVKMYRLPAWLMSIYYTILLCFGPLTRHGPPCS